MLPINEISLPLSYILKANKNIYNVIFIILIALTIAIPAKVFKVKEKNLFMVTCLSVQYIFCRVANWKTLMHKLYLLLSKITNKSLDLYHNVTAAKLLDTQYDLKLIATINLFRIYRFIYLFQYKLYHIKTLNENNSLEFVE